MERPATLDPNGFAGRDLHVIDVLRIPVDATVYSTK